MISEYQKHQADAIGMSGLLVKSTVVMKEDLITLNERGLNPPVILGGAALTRRYVEEDLRRLYRGPVFYGEDAFSGLRIMDEIVAKKRLTKVGSAALAGVATAATQQAGRFVHYHPPTRHAPAPAHGQRQWQRQQQR
jgi:5-methyltetrahydrofolate--homocysteine methyltransferase